MASSRLGYRRTCLRSGLLNPDRLGQGVPQAVTSLCFGVAHGEGSIVPKSRCRLLRVLLICSQQPVRTQFYSGLMDLH